jgi:putative oxidoreductase
MSSSPRAASARAFSGAQQSSGDLVITSPAIGIAARILFSLIFVLSGITHFTTMSDYVNLMNPAIPMRPFWVAISGAVELAGAALILFNYKPRLGAWLIVLFLVPVTLVVHGLNIFMLSDPLMRTINVSMLLKGFAMIGGALFITQSGVTATTR